MRKEIFTEKGAAPVGPYSQAVVADGPFVFVSGQGPVDPATGQMKLGSIAEQAEQVFENITTLLEAAGTSWEHVVRVGIFLVDMDDFAEMNSIYQRYLTKPYPARTTVSTGLPVDGMLIEVDCIAVVPEA
ncbi:MAG: RidA family protein [Anaerolineae bacterium]